MDERIIIDFLSELRGNSGEDRELIQSIAAANGFKKIQVQLIGEEVKYKYELNEIGRNVANQWAKIYDYIPCESIGEYLDKDEYSIRSAREMFGL